MNNPPDIASYTKDQLESVLLHIDKERFPERVAEIERRLKHGEHRRERGEHRIAPESHINDSQQLSEDLLAAERIGVSFLLFIAIYFLLNLFFQFGTDRFIFDLIPFIAGASLIRLKKQELETIATFRFFATAFIPGSILLTLLNFLLIQPWDLSQTQFQLFPLDSSGYLLFFVVRFALLGWAISVLGTPKILAFEPPANWLRFIYLRPKLIGVCVALFLTWNIYTDLTGPIAQQGIKKAQEEHGLAYSYTATEVSTQNKARGKSHFVAITAWNTEKILLIEEPWQEKDHLSK